MPIIVPPPPYSLPVDVSEEIIANIELTHYFIASDPKQIALIPHVDTRLPSGGSRMTAGTPRPIQTFRLIPMSHTEQPRRSTSASAAGDAGVQRRYDFTILGEWDSVMDVNDTWEDELGQLWVIDNLVPFNGYERKGLVVSYGKRPSHG